MSVEAPVPKDHPLMVAWAARKATQDHANNARWAVVPEFTTGALWGEFVAGWEAAIPAEIAALKREVERLKRLLNGVDGECASIMSRASLHKKRAMEDLHRSEENHQDGRWHAAKDIQEYLQRKRAALAHKEPGDEG